MGGGGRRGGGQAPAPENEGARGPSFFEQRDMDVPSRAFFFDPRPSNIKLVSFEELPPVPGLMFPKGDEYVLQKELKKDAKTAPELAPPPREQGGLNALPGFRGSVVTESLPELGYLIVNVNNRADLEQVLEIIRQLSAAAEKAQPKIEMVPLEYGDATAIVNILNQVYARLVMNVTGPLSLLPPRTGGGGGGQQQGALGAQQQGGGGQQGNLPISLMLIPMPRFNSIMVVASGMRMDDIIKEIKKLDRKNSPQAQAFAFPLHKASAQTVATMLNSFYTQRYPGEAALQHQIRFSFDTSSNQVFVQAGPEDLEEIRGLIERIDTTVSGAVNDLRVVRLRNALADDLATELQTALYQGIMPQSTAFPNAAAGGVGGAGAGGGAAGGVGAGGGAGAGGGGAGGFGAGGGAGGGGAARVAVLVPVAEVRAAVARVVWGQAAVVAQTAS